MDYDGTRATVHVLGQREIADGSLTCSIDGTRRAMLALDLAFLRRVLAEAPREPAAEDPDADLDGMTRAELLAHAREMRAGIRAHRDASGHDLCWHHPDLWALLPDVPKGGQVVPDWPQFLRGAYSTGRRSTGSCRRRRAPGGSTKNEEAHHHHHGARARRRRGGGRAVPGRHRRAGQRLRAGRGFGRAHALHDADAGRGEGARHGGRHRRGAAAGGARRDSSSAPRCGRRPSIRASTGCGRSCARAPAPSRTSTAFRTGAATGAPTGRGRGRSASSGPGTCRSIPTEGKGRVSKVIRNGTIVTADRTWKADVLVEGETIKAIGAGPQGRRGDRRHRRLRHPGRDRPAHPPRDAVHGDDGGGDLRVGHLRRRLGRDDDARRLRAAGAGREPAHCARRVGPQVEAADLRRRRLPHGDHRLEREDLARDGRGGEARGQHLQALHGLQGRADGGGRRDVRLLPPLRRARARCRSSMPRTATSWPRCRRSTWPRG